METPIIHGQNYQVQLWYNIIFNQAVQSEKNQTKTTKPKLSQLQRYKRDIPSQLEPAPPWAPFKKTLSTTTSEL